MIEKLLAQTQLKLYPEPVVVVGLDPETRRQVVELAHREGMISLVFLPYEVTMIVTEALWQEAGSLFPAAKVESGFRLLTLDITLPWNVVGYLARVTRILAEAEISVGVISSHASDHLLISEAELPKAIEWLANLGVTFKSD
ncbi:ACT domain-containing protein [Dethiobacter alkaliphilus]|uniref:ACT domain-containing protein n=1 Tax=Dethiobacter alkaliphilus TaxID=427926 RepID=UPI002226440E|nr:ACT domain-containing protein [Dethiobacter alkaliphilus]MCW3489799.1 ACT domain-containing protein [Dethiobacter alkaliphilus]